MSHTVLLGASSIISLYLVLRSSSPFSLPLSAGRVGDIPGLQELPANGQEQV
jgi:hypothetical protein